MGVVRFLLALTIVIGHAGGVKTLGYRFINTHAAVQSFYIISGFLITTVLNENHSYRSILRFYFSRYLRLWPAYIVVAVVSLLTFRWNLVAEVLPVKASGWSLAFMYFANLTLFFQDWVMFLRLTADGALSFTSNFRANGGALFNYLLVPQAWTLGVELSFYAIAPFVCRHWPRLLILMLGAIAVRFIVADYMPIGDPWSYRFAPSEMLFFASGGMAYHVGKVALKRAPNTVKVFGLLCAGLIAWGIVFGPSYEWIYNSIQSKWLWDELIINHGVFLALMAIAVSPMFAATGRNQWDRLIGELSYPIYISHYLILKLVSGDGDLIRENAVVYLVVIPVSAFIFFAIMKPVDRLRHRFVRVK